MRGSSLFFLVDIGFDTSIWFASAKLLDLSIFYEGWGCAFSGVQIRYIFSCESWVCVLLLVCKLDRYFLATSITQVQTQTTRVSLIIQRHL